MEETKQSKSNGGIYGFLLPLWIVIGAATAWAASPALFRALPTDMTRIGVLLDALSESKNQPNLVVFGSSVGMASADMNIINQQLDGKPLGWNMSSTGQSPIESYLYYQALPESVRLIVQFLNPESVTNRSVLNDQKFNAFYMHGYRPDKRTYEKLKSILGDEMQEILDKSDLQQRFDSRWAMRQVADHFARDTLRLDLTLEKSTYDLFNPSAYTKPIAPAAIEREFERSFGNQKNPNAFSPKPEKLQLLVELHERAQLARIDLVFVMQPQHPSQHVYRRENYYVDAYDQLNALATATNTILLDATNVIPAELFVDSVHPSPEGSELFSKWLVSELNSLKAENRIAF